jgi:hypothetical protein
MNIGNFFKVEYPIEVYAQICYDHPLDNKWILSDSVLREKEFYFLDSRSRQKGTKIDEDSIMNYIKILVNKGEDEKVSKMIDQYNLYVKEYEDFVKSNDFVISSLEETYCEDFLVFSVK